MLRSRCCCWRQGETGGGGLGQPQTMPSNSAAACQPFQEGTTQHYQHPPAGCTLPLVPYGGVAPWQLQASSPPVVSPQPQLAAAPPERSSSTGRSATSLKKVHSEAERRRRGRINAHLAAMRSIIPDTNQMDKATLLAAAVSRLKDLKRKMAACHSQQGTPPHPVPIIPAEEDGVTVDCCYTGAATTANASEREVIACIRASISCDDRPGLLADVAAAVRGLGMRAVRADVASLGGRARCSLVLCREDRSGGGGRLIMASEGAWTKKALELEEEVVRQALAGAAFAEEAARRCSGSRSKRQRTSDSRFVSNSY